MKNSTSALKNTVQREHAVGVRPRLIAEWEYNRFRTPTVTTTEQPGATAEDEWLTCFDSSSIALPNRPLTGSAKAKTGTKVKPANRFRDSPSSARYYPASASDPYKYWSSLSKCGTGEIDDAYNFATPVQVVVTYDQPVQANKIVAGFEMSYAKPVSYSLEYSVNGTTWISTDSVSALLPNGTVSVWRSGTDWVPDPFYTSVVTIKAVRLTIYSMDTPASHVDVLQLGARLENDLSDFLISYEVDMEVSERSFVAPLGRASANTANVQLSNIDSRFNSENTSSLYFDLIDKKVKFTVDIGVDATPQGGVKYEYVREFTMWTDVWAGQESTTVDVQLKDSSVFLQEVIVPEVFLEDYTVGAVVWQILDRIGMVNYQYSRSTVEKGQVIAFYWPEPERTIWDEFANLAEATQTAIFFDENDVLQIRARRSMYNSDKLVNWNLDAIINGTKLPDIESIEINNDMDANEVEILYQPASFSDFANGFPKMETVWEPDEDTVVLRSTDLTKDLLIAGTAMWIPQATAVIWPYEAMVNIRGEILRYKGKEYVWYKPTGGTEAKVVYSQEEKDLLDDGSHPDNKWKNYFSGKFVVAERGLYGTDIVDHKLITTPYTGAISSRGTAALVPFTGGWSQQNGFIRMTNVAGASAVKTHLRRHGTAVVAPVTYFGTRIRFNRGGKQAAGLWFDGSNLDAGYYLELITTEMADNIEKRAQRNELSLSSRVADNTSPNQGITDNSGSVKGAKHNISVGVWYALDVIWIKARTGVSEEIRAYLDGVLAGRWIVPSGKRPTPDLGRFGLWVRDASEVDFEYLYSVQSHLSEDADISSFLDLRRGGYTSGYIQRDWKFDTRYLNVFYRGKYFPQMVSRSNYAFDEFGPVVHEVREYDVRFKDESIPAAHSYLYFSNTSQVNCPVYESDAFGARFLLANADRDDAVLKGEDTVTFGPDNAVNQSMFIYGRAVYQEEEKRLVKRNEQTVRRRGLVKTEFSSRYIQSDLMAEDIGDWVLELWESGVDEVTVEGFGNPLLQLGDLVTINYPLRGMLPDTHRYFIVGVNNRYQNGYLTTLILRRAKL